MNLDGAYFGTTFAHLFLLLHPQLIPSPPEVTYIPRIYGFKISKDSEYHKARFLTVFSIIIMFSFYVYIYLLILCFHL
jgi:hypothetical protein